MIKNFLLDLIFPRFCLGCQKELNQKTVSFICETCFDNIPLNGVECHMCCLRNSDGVCLPAGDVPNGHKNCRRRTYLKAIFSAGKYENAILREAINKFKYNSVESLKKPLAELVIKYLKKENLIDKFENSILTPIPLSWRRKLNRGFNQSELLAMEISKYLNLQVANILKRKKFNTPQAKIQDWKERKENISGAFCLNPKFFNYPHLIPKTIDSRNQYHKEVVELGKIKKIVLIDDVATSGATLEEAARVLKEAGFKEVYGLVIAKG